MSFPSLGLHQGRTSLWWSFGARRVGKGEGSLSSWALLHTGFLLTAVPWSSQGLKEAP